MIRVQLRSIVQLVGLTAIMAGCDEGEHVDDANSDMRIETLRQSESGFKYTASRGDSLVTLTVQRNGLRGQEFVGDPDTDSPYDSDVILQNRHGFPFLTSGNHGVPVDPDKGPLSMVPSTRFVHQEQLQDLQLIIAAADALRARQSVGESFRWEIERLRGMATFALQNANNMLNETVSSALTSVPHGSDLMSLAPSETASKEGTTGGQTSSALASTFTHQVMIRKGPCFFCGDTGEHSAVLLNVYYDSGGFIGSVSTQNHGKEATDPAMTTAFNCPKSYSGRSVAFPNFQPYESSDVLWGIWRDAGGCHTSYGITSGKHVCNDDSQAQYNNIKYNLAGTWTFCQDSTLAYWAPYCN